MKRKRIPVEGTKDVDCLEETGDNRETTYFISVGDTYNAKMCVGFIRHEIGPNDKPYGVANLEVAVVHDGKRWSIAYATATGVVVGVSSVTAEVFRNNRIKSLKADIATYWVYASTTTRMEKPFTDGGTLNFGRYLLDKRKMLEGEDDD